MVLRSTFYNLGAGKTSTLQHGPSTVVTETELAQLLL